MLLEVIKFELRYRLNRPATYIYFVIFLLLSFLAVSWDGINIGGDIGKIKQNSSIVLFGIAGTLSIIPGIFFASAVMGVPILRDFEHKMESLIFTTNLTKFNYLAGRFLGSFFILLLISTGNLIGTFLGCQMPWLDQDTLLSVGIGQYISPWLILIVPNIFVCSCIFFASGALSRKMLFVYLQAIVLIAIYLIAGTLIGDVENIEKAGIFDPFGYYAFTAETRYWTVAEKNLLSVPFTGYLLLNRLLWMGLAVLVAIILFVLFKFRSIPSALFKRKKAKTQENVAAILAPIPFVKPSYSSNFKKITTLASLYFKEIIRSIPFIGIGLIGLIILLVDAQYASQWNGQDLYPVTSMIAGFVAEEIFPIIAIMTLFYAGEMVWREKQLNFHQIYDSLPISLSVPIISKFIALAGMILVYILCFIPIGIALQLFKGFTNIEFDVYFLVLLSRLYISMLIYLAIMLFMQSIVNNKFLGFALSVLLYMYILFSSQMKVFNNLLIPNSGNLGNYSDMNGFALGMEKFVVLKLYWVGIGIILLVLAVMFSQRGTETSLKSRMGNFKQRFKRSQLVYLSLGALLTLAMGSYYLYNISVLNTYNHPEWVKDQQASYEKTLKATYGKTLQPSVSDIVAKVELYPNNGDLALTAKITYKNLMPYKISQLLLQMPGDDDLTFSKMEFSVPMRLVKKYKDHKFMVYQLQSPLAPGDSLYLQLEGRRNVKGFKNQNSNVSYAENGTFINNFDIFPQFGYNRELELAETKDRKKRGLKEQEGLPPIDDQQGRLHNLFGQRGRTNLDITIGTLANQTAISPGYLIKTWKENDRAYFHYKMDKPIFNFFNIISGKYEVKKQKWNDVNLEIYYHKSHPFNIDVMFASLKKGLDYNTKNFGPYLYQQVRIIEFPRYRSFAQSFSNTIPFSESIGFIFKNAPEKLDMGYYVTAHELAHQWWGHLVAESGNVGNQMYSEGLSQYAALMLLKQTLPIEELSRYLKYELDGYLRGRSTEKKKENSLDQTDGQGYIHYQKGTLAYFALQDYIGEENVNKALKKLVTNYGNTDNYLTTNVLTAYFKEVTPDSLKYVVDDLFSKITLFENRVINPTAKKVGNMFEVSIPVQTLKYYADKDGNEKLTPIKDYIDIGAYAMDKKGKEKIIYLQKHKFTKDKSIIVIRLKEKPVRVGIDPIYKLIDRNTEDNKSMIN
ncbi:M1 family aminopeptidase [Pedobacter sp.]|uniref:ABC transporter permease/M1 family aminopeptidase n=1 Tax=Pedobacter sp. TaxID=1411316 RepID=UPI003D7FA163